MELKGPSKGLPKKPPGKHCNGRLTSRRGYCQKHAGWGVEGVHKGRCKQHGGKSLKGADHPNATHLRYSKYAPDKIVERYEAMVTDPKILNLREEIGIVRARISELLEDVKNRRTDQPWSRLTRQVQNMRAAWVRDDMAALTAALGSIENLVEDGFSARQSWFEIGDQMDRLSRLVTLERRHIVAMKYLMTVEDLGVLFTQVIQIIQLRMRDEDERRATVRDLRALLSQPNDNRPGPRPK